MQVRLILTCVLLAVLLSVSCDAPTGTDFSSLDRKRTDTETHVYVGIADISPDSLTGELQLTFWIAPPRAFHVRWYGYDKDVALVSYGHRKFDELHDLPADSLITIIESVFFNRAEPFALQAIISSYWVGAADTFIWRNAQLPKPRQFTGGCMAQCMYGDKVR